MDSASAFLNCAANRSLRAHGFSVTAVRLGVGYYGVRGGAFWDLTPQRLFQHNGGDDDEKRNRSMIESKLQDAKLLAEGMLVTPTTSQE